MRLSVVHDDLEEGLLSTVVGMMGPVPKADKWTYEFMGPNGIWVTVPQMYATSWDAGADAGMHLRLFPTHTVRLKGVVYEQVGEQDCSVVHAGRGLG